MDRTTLDKWNDITDAIQLSVCISEFQDREHQTHCRTQLARFLGLSALSIVSGMLAIGAAGRAVGHAKAHRNWQRIDKKLDKALAETAEASNATPRC